MHGKGCQNFGIVLSVWDWLFGTVYWPDDEEQPQRLGFQGMENYLRNVVGRLFYPFYRWPPLYVFRNQPRKETNYGRLDS